MLEKKLKELGFEVCWYKDGKNFSGHSLVSKFDEVDFRIMINHYSSPERIEVQLAAVASPTEKEAARKLMDYLGYPMQSTNGQLTASAEAQ